MCPRGDLNPQSRAFSPIPRLNTQVGEKSPVRGFHALMLAATPQPVSSRIRRVGLMVPGADAGDAQRWLARRRDCRASQAVTARTGTSRPGGPSPESRSEASQVTGGDRRCRHGRVLGSRRPRTRCATTPDGRNLVVGGLLFIAHRTMINGSAPCAAHLSRSVLAWLAPTGVEPSRTPTRRA